MGTDKRLLNGLIITNFERLAVRLYLLDDNTSQRMAYKDQRPSRTLNRV